MKYEPNKTVHLDQLVAHFTCPYCKQAVTCVVDYVDCHADEGFHYLGPQHEFELLCPKCKQFADGNI